MATDNIEICNKALLLVGAAKITALTDNTKEADACEFLYDDTRRRLLTKYDWPFAVATVDLGAEDDTTVAGWGYEYTLPAGVLRILRLEAEAESDGAVDGIGPDSYPRNLYEVRGTKIYCDIDDAWLKYVNDVTDTTTFPQDFEYALVTMLAAELAMPLTGDPQTEQRLMQKHLMALQAAYTSSSQLQRSTIPERSGWLDARN